MYNNTENYSFKGEIMTETLTPAVLYTEGTAAVNKEIEKELEVPDPPSDVAKAVLNKENKEDDEEETE